MNEYINNDLHIGEEIGVSRIRDEPLTLGEEVGVPLIRDESSTPLQIKHSGRPSKRCGHCLTCTEYGVGKKRKCESTHSAELLLLSGNVPQKKCPKISKDDGVLPESNPKKFIQLSSSLSIDEGIYCQTDPVIVLESNTIFS